MLSMGSKFKLSPVKTKIEQIDHNKTKLCRIKIGLKRSKFSLFT